VIVASALRESFREGYGAADLRADLLAGVVVGVVALPLSMALAIASGVAPQHGLYTAIVAGAVIALLGGSRVQVSGPTAAFVVILAPIAARHGLGGLVVATLLAGVLLVSLGAAGLGQVIEFVPHPVTTGFTAGIGVVLGTLQLRDFLGLSVQAMPDPFPEKVAVLLAALPTLRLPDLGIGLLTLLLLVFWPRLDRRVPAPLVALLTGSLVALLLTRHAPGFEVATIASRFSHQEGALAVPGIPRTLPAPLLPWHLPGPDGNPVGLSLGLLRSLLPAAFAIAALGAIESLLSATVADGMTGKRHDPNAELFAQGVGNLAAPFFGGIAATGAIARTATGVRSGARSPLAAASHALFVLLAVLVLAPALGYLPMASLAALLMLVAWNMSEARHFVHTVRVAPRGDVVVLLLCFGLTVVFDMVVSVTAGVILSSFLFMRRMADVSGVRLVAEDHPSLGRPLPRGVLFYEIAGPLFFGAAQKAMSAIESVERRGLKAVILDLGAVPTIDATGLVALESLVKKLNGAGVKVILASVEGEPLHAFARAGWRNRRGRLRIFRSREKALAQAHRYVEGLGADEPRA
jgi:SulP family sulfate permease